MHPFRERGIDIPAGKKLVLKSVMTVKGDICTNDTIRIENRIDSELRDNRQFANGRSFKGAIISTNIIDLPKCPVPDLTVTKTQDKDSVGLGEARTYTITYQNNSDFDVPIMTYDYAYMQVYDEDGSQVDYINLDVDVTTTCDPSSTMDCPDMFPKTVNQPYTYSMHPYKDLEVTIPAGKKLVLKSVMTANSNLCSNQIVKISNNVSVRRGSDTYEFPGGKSELAADVLGGVECADVSTSTDVSKKSVFPGDELTVTSVVDNSVGKAENVPFEMQLPTKNDKNVLDGKNFTPTCTVTKGNAQCPTDLRYDPATNKVLGTIPTMGPDSAISISMKTVFTESGRFTESYIVTSQAFLVKGDSRLGTEGVNRSSDTFAWDNYKVIPFPDAPQTEDPCGPNNIRWVKPEDTQSVRWEVKADGHAWAYTKPGYLFTGNVRNKDYGVATGESNEACPVTVITVPPTPQVNDQCGPDNAIWVVPQDSDQVRFELTADKRLVAYAKDGFRFEGDKDSHDYGTAVDSGDPCPPTVVPVPPTPDVSQSKCDHGNGNWQIPIESDELRWEVTPEKHLVVHAKEGYVLEGGKTSHDYGIAPVDDEDCDRTRGTWGMTPSDPGKAQAKIPVLVKKKELPNTGFDSGIGFVSLMTLVAGLGLVAVSRRKQTK